MNLNLKVKKEATYDAIVVGTGVSGGWAAKELTEKGLKTLVLERGRMVKHIEDYTTAHLNPWELSYGNRLTTEEEKIFHAQKRTGYSPRQADKQWWVNDLENPYTEIKPFAWVRGYHLGGRSITWGRHSYRLSDIDFEANAKDGIAVDWPIRYKDLAPWYDYVESFIGVNGQPEGLPQLPDGKYQPPMELNCLEKHVKQKIAENFSDRILTSGRTANLTQPHHGRGQCQYRDRCIRGCPFGAYFSSLSSTLPAAEQTGNMTIRPFSIVTEVIFDESKNKATGVRVLDAETRETVEFYAPVIFLNASTLGSTFILLNSRSNRFPNGLGNRSGELGHNLMDHHLGVGAEGEYDGFQDQYYSGRRPNGVYVPRFRNIKDQRKDYIRGFGYQGGASRGNWWDAVKEMSIGLDLKKKLVTPGIWKMGLSGFGEVLPYHENKISLNEKVRDVYGLPTLSIDCEIKENEKAMRKDMANSAGEMLEAAGLKNVLTGDLGFQMGLGIHELGTARMGKDPKTSVLNKFNQVHEAPNVFVTDGAAMTSAANQNPSLTYMALTARAANYAVDLLKKGNLK